MQDKIMKAYKEVNSNIKIFFKNITMTTIKVTEQKKKLLQFLKKKFKQKTDRKMSVKTNRYVFCPQIMNGMICGNYHSLECYII